MRLGQAYQSESALAMTRRALGWRQSRLASAIEVCTALISFHEVGQTRLTEENLRRALKALKISARSAIGEAILAESREQAREAKRRAGGK